MNRTDLDSVDDASLVTWLDGELGASESRRIAEKVAADPALQRRVGLLQAARRELVQALRDGSMDDARLASRRGRLMRRIEPWLVAAALVIVVTIAFLTRSDPSDRSANAVENQLLRAVLRPERDHFPIFGDIRFRIEARCLSDVPCRVVERRAAESDADLAARLAADPTELLGIPLVLDGAVIAPDGAIHDGILLRTAGRFGKETTALRFALEDLLVDHGDAEVGTINPAVSVREIDSGFVADWDRQFRALGDMNVGGKHGFVPELPGEWRLELTLRSFTSPLDSRWICFAEPLRFACRFRVDGVVGHWSAPVDGLRARLVASAASTRSDRPVALALQIENRSDRARGYNIAGRTLAAIPQPFHMTLLEDGREFAQRGDLGLVTSAASGFLPQPVGTARSIVVLSDFWTAGEGPALTTPGLHRVALRFHFQPTAWQNGDELVWMGSIETPALELRVEPVR